MATDLKAQTYVDVEKGLEHVQRILSTLMWGDGGGNKIRLTTKEGVLDVVCEIEEVLNTVCEVVRHDTKEQRGTLMRLIGRG